MLNIHKPRSEMNDSACLQGRRTPISLARPLWLGTRRPQAGLAQCCQGVLARRACPCVGLHLRGVGVGRLAHLVACSGATSVLGSESRQPQPSGASAAAGRATGDRCTGRGEGREASSGASPAALRGRGGPPGGAVCCRAKAPLHSCLQGPGREQWETRPGGQQGLEGQAGWWGHQRASSLGEEGLVCSGS